MIRAIVLDTDVPFLTRGASGSSVSPETRLAGLSLSRRAAMEAWRSGAQHITFLLRDATAIARWERAEPALPIPITFAVSSPELPRFADDDRVLVLSAQVMAGRELLSHLLETQTQAGYGVVASTSDLNCFGPAVLTGRKLNEALEEESSPVDGIRRVLSTAGTVSVELGSYRHLDSCEAVAAADRLLYQGLTSITDGYIDRVFNRRISGWCTRRIINLPISPNQVTWFHFTLGLLSAWMFWQGSYPLSVLGAALFQFSVALDCTDGEIARLKYQYSKFGSWFDVWADNVVTVAVFAAIAHAAASRLGVPLALTLGALAVCGVLMCVLVIFGLAKLQSRHRPGEASALAATNRLSHSDQAKSAAPETLTQKVINEATSRDFSVIVVAFALMGRLEWFAWLAGVGSHVFWIVFAAIQLSMLRTANAQSR